MDFFKCALETNNYCFPDHFEMKQDIAKCPVDLNFFFFGNWKAIISWLNFHENWRKFIFTVVKGIQCLEYFMNILYLKFFKSLFL